MINPRSIKVQLIIFLVLLAAFVATTGRDMFFLVALVICTVTSVATEALAFYVRTRRWQVTESALVAGLIVGFVVSSGAVWWKLVAVSATAILSKHAIRFHNRHIFNPAAFGVLAGVLFLRVPSQWTATYLWYFLVPFGGYLAWKMRRLEVLAGYAGMAVLTFGTQTFLQHQPLSALLGYFSYFYIFIMVVEPKTTPTGVIGKYLFGAGVAALVFVLTQVPWPLEVELSSLLIMNAFILLLNKLPVKQGGKR